MTGDTTVNTFFISGGTPHAEGDMSFREKSIISFFLTFLHLPWCKKKEDTHHRESQLPGEHSNNFCSSRKFYYSKQDP